jgi:hypothetical protein
MVEEGIARSTSASIERERAAGSRGSRRTSAPGAVAVYDLVDTFGTRWEIKSDNFLAARDVKAGPLQQEGYAAALTQLVKASKTEREVTLTVVDQTVRFVVVQQPQSPKE